MTGCGREGGKMGGKKTPLCFIIYNRLVISSDDALVLSTLQAFKNVNLLGFTEDKELRGLIAYAIYVT